MDSKQLYKVSFINQDKVYEVFARNVYESDLYGFVIVEEFVFGQRSSIVVDPSEEKLRNEFDDVKRSFIPLHAVIRIDEVEHEGTSKIRDLKSDSNVTAFPTKGFPGKGER